VIQQIIDHTEMQEKVVVSVSFFFFFWGVHSLLAREAVTTKLGLFSLKILDLYIEYSIKLLYNIFYQSSAPQGSNR